MANIEKSKDIHKAINETLINAFNKRSMKVLSSRSVSKEQYFYWALDRSRKNIFLSGLVISSIFISFFIYIWLSQSNNLDPSFSELFVASAIPFFFIIMFTVLVIAAKRGTLFGVSDRNFQNLSWGYYMMDVLRRTSHKSITKISEKTWTQIKAFDLIAAKERFNPKIQEKSYPRIGKFIQSLKPFKSYPFVALGLGALTFAIAPNSFVGQMITLISAIILLLAWGLSITLKSFVAFLTKDITVPDHWGNARYQGIIAQFLAVLWGLVGLLLLLAIIIPLIAILYYRF